MVILARRSMLLLLFHKDQAEQISSLELLTAGSIYLLTTAKVGLRSTQAWDLPR